MAKLNEVTRHIVDEARVQGVSPIIALAIAQQESGFNPSAKAPTSTASGIYQFLDGTWDDEIVRLGLDYSREDRFDFRKNIEVGIAHIRRNLEAVGADPLNPDMLPEAYFAHFGGLGRARAMAQLDENAPAGKIPRWPQALKSNRFLRSAKTVGDARRLIEGKVSRWVPEATQILSAYSARRPYDIRIPMTPDGRPYHLQPPGPGSGLPRPKPGSASPPSRNQIVGTDLSEFEYQPVRDQPRPKPASIYNQSGASRAGRAPEGPEAQTIAPIDFRSVASGSASRAEVERAQRHLRDLGFDIAVDGIAGPRTRETIRAHEAGAAAPPRQSAPRPHSPTSRPYDIRMPAAPSGPSAPRLPTPRPYDIRLPGGSPVPGSPTPPSRSDIPLPATLRAREIARTAPRLAPTVSRPPYEINRPATAPRAAPPISRSPTQAASVYDAMVPRRSAMLDARPPVGPDPRSAPRAAPRSAPRAPSAPMATQATFGPGRAFSEPGFLSRAAGAAGRIGDAIYEGASEAFDAPIGIGPETRRDLESVGLLLPDGVSPLAAPISAANEALIGGGAAAGDLVLRALNAPILGGARGAGQLAREWGASQGQARRLERDLIAMADAGGIVAGGLPAGSLGRFRPRTAQRTAFDRVGEQADDVGAGPQVPDVPARASKGDTIFDPPDLPQRPFDRDYPEGATSLTGEPLQPGAWLEFDIDGRLLNPEALIVGRRTVDGEDIPLTPAEIEEVGRQLNAIYREVPGDEIGDDLGVTRLLGDPDTGELNFNVLIDQDVDERIRELTRAHETGHVMDLAAGDQGIDPIVGGISEALKGRGLEDELGRVYDTLATGMTPAGKPVGPRGFGYTDPEEIHEELVVEALRAYLSNPNYVKTAAPNVARALREAVNQHPVLERIVQLNSIATPLVGGTAAAAFLGGGEASAAPQAPQPYDISVPASGYDFIPQVDPRPHPTGQAIFPADDGLGGRGARRGPFTHDFSNVPASAYDVVPSLTGQGGSAAGTLRDRRIAGALDAGYREAAFGPAPPAAQAPRPFAPRPYSPTSRPYDISGPGTGAAAALRPAPSMPAGGMVRTGGSGFLAPQTERPAPPTGGMVWTGGSGFPAPQTERPAPPTGGIVRTGGSGFLAPQPARPSGGSAPSLSRAPYEANRAGPVFGPPAPSTFGSTRSPDGLNTTAGTSGAGGAGTGGRIPTVSGPRYETVTEMVYDRVPVTPSLPAASGIIASTPPPVPLNNSAAAMAAQYMHGGPSMGVFANPAAPNVLAVPPPRPKPLPTQYRMVPRQVTRRVQIAQPPPATAPRKVAPVPRRKPQRAAAPANSFGGVTYPSVLPGQTVIGIVGGRPQIRDDRTGTIYSGYVGGGTNTFQGQSYPTKVQDSRGNPIGRGGGNFGGFDSPMNR